MLGGTCDAVRAALICYPREGSDPVIVVLAEKPSVARDLAHFLGAKSKREGYQEGNGYQVTWAYGHLVTLKEPHDYDSGLKRWSLGSLPIIPERFGLKVIGTAIAKKQFRIVKGLLRGADEVICATDAGREGELIFRYIRQLAGATGKPTKRLWLSSLTPQAVRQGFENLRPANSYDALFHAARCRSEADWIVGLNATRNYTVRFGRKGQLWSVGRVQTPVLAMIVERDTEIDAFRPQPFWDLVTLYRDVTFKYAGNRFDAAEPAGELLEKVQGQPFSITSLATKDQRVPPPLLYDLTDLQRDMNRRFGMSASATLKTAQELYEKKLLTYPRTDSRYLSRDMKGQVNRTLGDLAPRFSDAIGRLDLQQVPFSKRVFDDAKVSDHHAIIPTGKLPGELGGTLGRVFDAVATRFIAAFYPWCEKRNTTVSGESAGVPFQARGTLIVKPGWTVLYPKRESSRKEHEADGDPDQELPDFRQGESGAHEPTVKDGMTKPPQHYTESSLLSAMETCGKSVDDEQLREALKERGLGTPATRAQTIETLIGRSYITRNRKQLLATDLGRYLIALIRNPQLKSAELTGQWEERLKLIEKGLLSPDQFMQAIGEYTRSILEDSAHANIDATRIGSCPLCGSEVIEGQRGVGCSKWREGCPFVLWRQYKGSDLDSQQVRQLVQLRGIAEPTTIIDEGGMRQVLLSMTPTGTIIEVPVPIAPTSRQTSGRGKRKYPVRRASAKQAASANAPSGAGVPQEPGEAMGSCPICGKDVIETAKAYGCSAWRDGCKFTIWKQTAGKRISRKTAEILLEKGKTGKLKGFKSKAGRPFEAFLVIKDGAVTLDFGS